MRTILRYAVVLAAAVFGVTVSRSLQAAPLVQHNYVLSFSILNKETGAIGFGSIDISTCGHTLRRENLKVVEVKLIQEYSAAKIVFLGSIPLEETTCRSR